MTTFIEVLEQGLRELTAIERQIEYDHDEAEKRRVVEWEQLHHRAQAMMIEKLGDWIELLMPSGLAEEGSVPNRAWTGEFPVRLHLDSECSPLVARILCRGGFVETLEGFRVYSDPYWREDSVGYASWEDIGAESASLAVAKGCKVLDKVEDIAYRALTAPRRETVVEEPIRSGLWYEQQAMMAVGCDSSPALVYAVLALVKAVEARNGD